MIIIYLFLDGEHGCRQPSIPGSNAVFSLSRLQNGNLYCHYTSLRTGHVATLRNLVAVRGSRVTKPLPDARIFISQMHVV